MISPALSGVDSLSVRVLPSLATNSIFTSVASSIVTDCSFEKKSPLPPIVPTRVFDFGDHAPIECGCLRA